MSSTPLDTLALEFRKVARLLALEAIDGKTKSEATVLLNIAGFDNAEIALLIGTSEGSVRAMLSQSRRAGRDGEV